MLPRPTTSSASGPLAARDHVEARALQAPHHQVAVRRQVVDHQDASRSHRSRWRSVGRAARPAGSGTAARGRACAASAREAAATGRGRRRSRCPSPAACRAGLRSPGCRRRPAHRDSRRCRPRSCPRSSTPCSSAASTFASAVPARVVEVHGHRGRCGTAARSIAHELAHLRRHSDPDGIADRDLVAAEPRRAARATSIARAGSTRPFVGAAERGRDVAAHAQPLAARLGHEVGEALEGLVDRRVDVLAAEALAGRGEDRDLARAGRARRARSPGGSAPAPAGARPAACGRAAAPRRSPPSAAPTSARRRPRPRPRGRPASTSASQKATLSSTGAPHVSFCRPSRGPTSTTVTEAGRRLALTPVSARRRRAVPRSPRRSRARASAAPPPALRSSTGSDTASACSPPAPPRATLAVTLRLELDPRLGLVEPPVEEAHGLGRRGDPDRERDRLARQQVAGRLVLDGDGWRRDPRQDAFERALDPRGVRGTARRAPRAVPRARRCRGRSRPAGPASGRAGANRSRR